MKRMLAEGRERFEMWVAAAVLANKPHEDCSLIGGPIIAQTKSRLTLQILRSRWERAAEVITNHVPSNGGVREIATNIESEHLATKHDIDRPLCPILLGNLRMRINPGVSRTEN